MRDTDERKKGGAKKGAAGSKVTDSSGGAGTGAGKRKSLSAGGSAGGDTKRAKKA